MASGACGAAAMLLAALSGCTQLNNPFRDSGADSRSHETTPSAAYYTAHADAAPPPMRRAIPPARAYYENGAVTHWPVWFEDPFEDKGNSLTGSADHDAPDNEFALNAADILHGGYGPGRLMLNIFGLPFSAIAQPPGWVMASDGKLSPHVLGYDHDSTYAKRGAEAPDRNDVNRTRDWAMRDMPAMRISVDGESAPAAPATGAAQPAAPSGADEVAPVELNRSGS
ncbi:MAG: hypothetical protein U1A27_01025 [Phycisphaerae bacterium]